MKVGEIKVVRRNGEIIGCYTYRDDGCYEATKLNKYYGFVSLVWDTIAEAKKWIRDRTQK